MPYIYQGKNRARYTTRLACSRLPIKGNKGDRDNESAKTSATRNSLPSPMQEIKRDRDNESAKTSATRNYPSAVIIIMLNTPQ